MASNPTRWRRQSCAATICLLAAAQAAVAQLPDFPKFGALRGPNLGAVENVTLEAQFTPAERDRPALMFVTAKIAPGYHVNATDQGSAADGSGGPQPTTITLAENDAVKLTGEFRSLEAPKSRVDSGPMAAWPGLELREHERQVTWAAPIEIAAGADLTSLTVEGLVEGQVCSDRLCIPLELPFAAKSGPGVPLPDWFLSGGEVSAAAAPGAPGEVVVGASAVDAGSSLGTVAFYGILGGLILNLMPCVLPVIGLKILSFAKQGGESRRHVLGLNLAYSAGLLTVFMVLATLAALVQLGLSNNNLAWGELNTLTWFKVAMTALVFAMALAFLGVWEIPIPGFASSKKATELAAKEGPVGAFCMGMFTTLLATPCSGPFLGPVFGYTITKPPAVTYLVFGSVGVGMALPYLAIGAFPQLVSRLPKPGAWMDTLKQLLGFVLLATVVFLFSSISAEYFLPTLALLFSIWFGCWFIGRVPAWAETAYKRTEWLKGIAAAAVIGGASFSLMSPSETVLPWQPYSPAALAEARAQGKTVLVDFTANWCLTCKLNLKAAINREEVRQLVERNGVVPMLADWTDKNDTIKQALAELNSLSIPLMAIYPADPDAEVIVLPDLISKGDVVEALEAAGPSIDAGADARNTKTASRAMSASER